MLDAQNVRDFINIVENLIVQGLVLVLFCQAVAAVIRTHSITKTQPAPQPKLPRKKVVKGSEREARPWRT
jgi:hypothetical protein